MSAAAVPTLPRCPEALQGEPEPLQCILRQGYRGEHEAVHLASRTTYRWAADYREWFTERVQ